MITENSRETALQQIVGSMPIHVAVVDRRGRITFASRNWQDFGQLNGGASDRIGVGVDYLAVLTRAAARSDPYAGAAANGIRSVLERHTRTFSLEYPCHTPTQPRWFVMRVDPMPTRHRGAVVCHFDVTDRVLTRQRLRESLERYELATLGGRVALWEWDIGTGALRVDPSLRRLLGLTDQEMENQVRSWVERIHPEDRPRFEQSIEAHLRGESPAFEIEHRRLDAANTAHWFLTRGSVRRGAAGRPVRMIGLDTEISERKAAEEALVRETRRYQDIFVAAGVAIWEADYSAASQLIRRVAAQGVTNLRAYLLEHPDEVEATLDRIRLLDANPQALRLVNARSKQFFVDRAPRGLLVDVERHLLEQIVALAGGQKQYSAEARLRTLDGELRDVLMSARFPRPAGTQQTALLCMHDITELASFQQRYTMATTAGSVSVFDYDISSGTVDFDSLLYSITGLPAASAHGEAEMLALVHPADRLRLLQHARSVFAAQAVRDEAGHTPWLPVEFRLRVKNSGTRWMLTRGTLVRALDGTPLRLVGTLTDITSLKAGEAVLRRAHRQVRDLTAQLIAEQEAERRRIARELHDDVNQRLAGAAITLSNLQQSLSGGPRSVRTCVTRLQTEIHSLIIGFRRISRDLHPAVLEHAGLEPALRSLCHEFGRAHQLAVQVQISNVDSSLPAHVAMSCYRVVQEGLRNVARHARASACTVTLRRQNGALRLSVRDYGAGFDIRTLGRSTGGYGLFSMRGCVRILGGQLRLASRPGRGSELRASIPLPERAQA